MRQPAWSVRTRLWKYSPVPDRQEFTEWQVVAFALALNISPEAQARPDSTLLRFLHQHDADPHGPLGTRAGCVSGGVRPWRRNVSRDVAARGRGARAFLWGDGGDFPAVLASMDVAVLTSDSESLSNVILEAMASALPVVAYDVGGNAELVNDQRVMLVDANDENAFANSVRRLLSDTPLRQRIGANSCHFLATDLIPLRL